MLCPNDMDRELGSGVAADLSQDTESVRLWDIMYKMIFWVLLPLVVIYSSPTDFGIVCCPQVLFLTI